MGTTAAPEGASTTQYSLTSPPPGATFDYDEVKTDRGQKSLGQAPLLTWEETPDGLQKAIDFYGADGVCRFINGTSLRVSLQGIARRMKQQGKSDEDIATEELKFRPGSRQVGQSTPASRAAAAARKAAAKVNGDAMTQLLDRIASGAISEDQLKALGIDVSLAVPTEEDEDEENGQE